VRRLARVETDGVIGSYIHGGRIGVLVAVKGGSEELAKGVAMHVAAMNPQYVRAEDVPADFIEKEKEIALAAMSDKEKAKPADILEKIVSGKINKIVSEVTLLGQPYVLDTNVSVGDALKKDGAEVVSVVRLAVGEGIEKVEEDFAAEVMKQAGLA
jgi:elongation factor Ts